METITRNITDLAADERNVMERFLGRHLNENQRIVVQVLDADDDEGTTTYRGRLCDPRGFGRC